MRVLVVLLPLALAGLAGCSDDGGGGGAASSGTGTHAHGDVDPATHLVLPEWQVGDWWQLSSEQAPDPFTYVVSGESGSDWIIDTDGENQAFFNARFDISFLGPVRKSDLAGSQGSDRVEFLRFPLTTGLNWSTTWDGLPIDIAVTEVAAGVARLAAVHANGTPYAEYAYSAAERYFTEFTFFDTDGVAVSFAWTLQDSGSDYAGDLVRWTLVTLFESHDVGPITQNFDVDTGPTDIWADLHFSCQQGAFSITFGPLTGASEERGLTASGPCPAQLDETSTITPPQMDNEAWGVASGSATTGATMDLILIARTQTLFKAGAAP